MQQELIRQTPLWAENWPIAYSVIQAIVILLVVVLIAALMSFIERRLLGLWQDRYGPNRVGPGGMFQIVADMLKIMFKEDWTPKFADKLTFRLAPPLWSEPCRSWGDVPDRCRHVENHVQRRLDTKVC